MLAGDAKSLVLEHPVASPEACSAHFAARLAVETDPSDVYADSAAGAGGFVVVDSRSPLSFRQGHVPGAVNLPHREIDASSTARFRKEELIVVYCWGPACNAAHKAGVKLARLGFSVKEMIGGFEYWVKEGFPVEGTHAENPPLYAPHLETAPA